MNPQLSLLAVEVFHVLHTIYEVLQCEIGIDFTISRLISNNISTKATSLKQRCSYGAKLA